MPTIVKHLSLGAKTHQNLPRKICQLPVMNITYLKIHKTGSSTLAKVFNLFGYLRNLSFLLPKDVKCGRGYVWEMKSTSEVRTDSLGYSVNNVAETPPGYNLFTLHSTYNHKVLEKLMAPGSQYVSSLREPVGQFESAFTYYQFGLALPMELQDHSIIDKLRGWFKNPQHYKSRYEAIVKERKLVKSSDSYLYCHNSQMRDLGFDMQHQESRMKVSQYVTKLDKEFDFVLIMEYFDESLLLMKKQFCWGIEDILYIPENQRPEKMKSSSLPGDISKSILRWNSADHQLYMHFNRTLWKKIKEYGSSFESDLKEFRDRLKVVFNSCIGEQVDKEKYARVKYIQRKHAPDYCTLLAMPKNDLMDKIRERQQ